VRQDMPRSTAQRHKATFEQLALSMAFAPNDTRRILSHLVYWATYPITLLESGLMACISLVSYCIWRIAYLDIWHSKDTTRLPPSEKQKIDASNALGVMQTIERIAQECRARAFWISGTLLGLERIGKPLPHDNDMDLGLDLDDPHHLDFLRTLWESSEVTTIAPQYISLKVRIQNPDLRIVPGGIIRFKSFIRNERAPQQAPVKVDIFLHFPYLGGSMHGSRNTLWWNSPFHIVAKRYGDNSFSIPENTHLHLTENYGDYKTETKDFENCIDCPNALSIFSWESLAYLLVRQKAMLRRGRVDRAGQISRRIGATVLKGIVPLHLRNTTDYLGSKVFKPSRSKLEEMSGVRSK
jgi:hypothetical protein